MAHRGGFVCIYRGCSSKTGEGISLFTVPKDPVLAKEWLKACNREDLLDKDVDFHKNYRLCEKHFEDKYICKGGTRKTLLVKAVPTIFAGITKHNVPDCTFSEEPTKKLIVLSDITIAPALEKIPETDIAITTTPCSSPTPGPSGIEKFSFVMSPQETPASPKVSPSTSTQTPSALSSRTPRKSKLRMKLKALRSSVKKKLISAKKKELGLDDFHNLCDRYLTEPLSTIVKTQAILKDKKPLGRRYSIDYKQFALTLYFLSPRAYKFMSKLWCLPTKKSLHMITEKLVCKAGLGNDAIFKALEIKVKTMLEDDKHCTLCIDEMALKSHLFYHTGRDEIVGLVDTGSESKEYLIARNVLVIMARGLYSNWKQPVAYFFVSSTMEVSKLRPIIELCILKLSNLGLYVEAVVSDMGGNFIELSKNFGVSPEDPEFVLNGKKIIYLFDPCHLIKATRNNLIKNVFSFDGKKTCWSFTFLFT